MMADDLRPFEVESRPEKPGYLVDMEQGPTEEELEAEWSQTLEHRPLDIETEPSMGSDFSADLKTSVDRAPKTQGQLVYPSEGSQELSGSRPRSDGQPLEGSALGPLTVSYASDGKTFIGYAMVAEADEERTEKPNKPGTDLSGELEAEASRMAPIEQKASERTSNEAGPQVFGLETPSNNSNDPSRRARPTATAFVERSKPNEVPGLAQISEPELQSLLVWMRVLTAACPTLAVIAYLLGLYCCSGRS